jgi:hypothetical protein
MIPAGSAKIKAALAPMCLVIEIMSVTCRTGGTLVFAYLLACLFAWRREESRLTDRRGDVTPEATRKLVYLNRSIESNG